MAAGTDDRGHTRRPFGMLAWTLLVTVGVVVGLAAPVAAYVAATRVELPMFIIYPTLALAGAVQGLVLGITQALALYRTVMEVPRAAWSLITMVGALVAWGLGMLPATFEALGEPLDLDSRRVLAMVLAGGVVLLLIVPFAQWLLLRRLLPGAWLWIAVEAVAIAVALATVAGLSVAVDTSRPLADLAPVLAVGGGAVALAFALITGFGLLMMAPRRAPAGG